jgi:hypothetical protein
VVPDPAPASPDAGPSTVRGGVAPLGNGAEDTERNGTERNGTGTEGTGTGTGTEGTGSEGTELNGTERDLLAQLQAELAARERRPRPYRRSGQNGRALNGHPRPGGQDGGPPDLAG